MTKNDSDCEFCEEVASHRIPKAYSGLADGGSRVVRSTTEQIVVPSISPLGKNHVLIVPRVHVKSSVQLDAEARATFEKCKLDVVRDLTMRMATPVVVFEHGVGRDHSGGCGVSHCHVHVLPMDIRYVPVVLAAFMRDTHGELLPLSQLDSTMSYATLEVYGGAGTSRVARHGHFPSQYIRHLIERALGLKPTHWRDMVRPEWFAETLGDPMWA